MHDSQNSRTLSAWPRMRFCNVYPHMWSTCFQSTYCTLCRYLHQVDKVAATLAETFKGLGFIIWGPCNWLLFFYLHWTFRWRMLRWKQKHCKVWRWKKAQRHEPWGPGHCCRHHSSANRCVKCISIMPPTTTQKRFIYRYQYVTV